MDIEVIEPNEYIRTEKGHISQNLTTISWIAKDTTIDGDLVVKHSKNVLDLIEEGDFVNGYKVLEVCAERGWIEVDCNKPSAETAIWENEIKEILTHEQYERNAYRLEE